MTEDEMVGWHHRLNGHEFEQTLGDGEGQGSLACCIPRGHKELGTTERVCVCSNPVLLCVASLWLSSPMGVNSFRGIGLRSPKSLPYSLLFTHIHVCPCGFIHLRGNC